MNWPWVTRFAYDEMKAMLSRRVEQLEADNRLLLDRIAQFGMGRPIFSEPPAEEPVEMPKPASELEEAIQATGQRNPRAIVDHITRKRSEDFYGEPVKKVLAHFDAAVEEGRQIASTKGLN